MKHSTVNIQELIQQMTPEEKVQLLNGGSSFGSFPIERLGIQEFNFWTVAPA